jgi:hypothetical protein
MDLTKIRLSKDEMELVCNAQWILTKNEILNKTTALLADLQQQQQQWLSNHPQPIAAVWQQTAPKIAKGENYNGLPYRLLDFPAFFNKQDIMAIRTMFWWGNFFSITIHLSGIYKAIYQEKIIASLNSFKEEGFYICINDDQWQHHFGESNYLPANMFTNEELEKIIKGKDFLKLSYKVSVTAWPNVTTALLQKFRLITNKIAY